MQRDFTDLRINQTVASPRSQVEPNWIFANEVLQPDILMTLRIMRPLPFVPTLLRENTIKLVPRETDATLWDF